MTAPSNNNLHFQTNDVLCNPQNSVNPDSDIISIIGIDQVLWGFSSMTIAKKLEAKLEQLKALFAEMDGLLHCFSPLYV